MLGPSSDRIATLLTWCADNGILIDPRLQIRETVDNGLAVFSVGAITGNLESLVQIPKSAVLSVRSCSFAGHIDAVSYGHGAHLSLALALFVEILKGETSEWFGYLQSLPSEIVDSALFWGFEARTHLTNRWDVNDGNVSSTEGEDDSRLLSDGREALMWLRGTEVQKLLRGSGDASTSLLDEIRDYYTLTVLPLVSGLSSDYHQTPTLSGFYRAYALVSSRAFLVDAYHSLAMVPIADVFNHALENHVQLESDFYVCSMCGSVRECVHDEDESGYLVNLGESIPEPADASIASTVTREQDKSAHVKETCNVDNCYEMVTCGPIVSGSEVFNTYGEKIANAELLAQYGFLLDGNEHDSITWELEELCDMGIDGTEWNWVKELWREIDKKWSDEWRERLRDSKLVYSEGDGPGSGRGRLHGSGREKGVWTRSSVFRLSGDGKITDELWLFCGLTSLGKAAGTASRQGIGDVKLLGEVVDLQMSLEKEVEKEMTDDEEEDGGGLLFGAIHRRQPRQEERQLRYDERYSRTSPTNLKTMGLVIQMVISLCKAKKRKLGKAGADLTSLGEVADHLPEHMTRTRLAVSQVMSEYSLLNACESGWSELANLASVLWEHKSLLTSDSS